MDFYASSIVLGSTAHRSGRVETDQTPELKKANGVDEMKNLVSKFIKDESGATAIEYGLIAALIAVVIIGAVTTLGTNLTATFDAVSGELT